MQQVSVGRKHESSELTEACEIPKTTKRGSLNILEIKRKTKVSLVKGGEVTIDNDFVQYLSSEGESSLSWA